MPKLRIIQDILESRNISVPEFCKEINMSVAGFKRIIDRNSTRIQTLEKIAEALNCPVGIFFNEVKENKMGKRQQLIPHIPVSAQAGSLSGLSDGISQGICEMNAKIETLGNYDFTIEVHGDSMLPEYRSGDVVACKTIQSDSPLRQDAVYILDTVQGVIMKKIKKCLNDTSNIQCISLNENYAPFLLPRSDIFAISVVVGIIKTI